MNGVHDLGGMDGFGSVVREENEPVFHADWERRIFALAVSAIGARHFNVDELRRTIERIPPVQYLASTYYERWLYALEALLVEKGVVGRDEIAAATAAMERNVANVPDPSGAVAAAMSAEDANIPFVLAGEAQAENRPDGATSATAPEAPRGRTTALRYDSSFSPRFKAGDNVIARNLNHAGHTRLPRYVRGKHGVIYRDWGVFVFPDTHAHGLGTKPQHCYSVSFSARELWGEDRRGDETIYIDLWEDYLRPARAAAPKTAVTGPAKLERSATPRKSAKPATKITAKAGKPARSVGRTKTPGKLLARAGKSAAAKKEPPPSAKKAGGMRKKSMAKSTRRTVKNERS